MCEVATWVFGIMFFARTNTSRERVEEFYDSLKEFIRQAISSLTL